MKFGSRSAAPIPRTLVPVTTALVLALTACGGADDTAPDQAEASPSAAEESPTQETEDETGPEFDLPADCEAAGAGDVALAYLPGDAEQITDEAEEDGVSCHFASREGQRGVNLSYSAGFTLADMPDIEDNYETVGEVQDRDLRLTDRASELGGVLEDGDMGDVSGRGVSLHLPGGLFISAVSIGQDSADQALTPDELDEVVVEAAEALL